GQPYIRTALAKDLSWRQVVFQHALPNAAIPTVTLIGMMVGGLIAGAVVVETVFSWLGEGRVLVSVVVSRDLSVVQAILFVVVACMVIANRIVYALYVILDPRLRTGNTRAKALRNTQQTCQVNLQVLAAIWGPFSKHGRLRYWSAL